MRKLCIFALLLAALGGSLSAQTPAGAYSSPAAGGSGTGLPSGGSIGNIPVNTAPGIGTWQNMQNISGLCTASQGCTGVASPTAHALLAFEGASPAQNVCTPPSANGDYAVLYHITGAAAVDPTCPQTGLGGAAGLTGASTTYLVAFSDNVTVLTHDKAASGAINVTLPTATTLGNPLFTFKWSNHSAQTDTITPTTWTIQKNALVAAAFINVGSGETCLIKVDPNLGTQWLADCTSLGGALPASAKVLGTNGSSAGIAALQTDVNSIGYAAGGGSAQAQTVTLAPAITALGDGLLVCWKPTAANTAPAPTLAVNGLTATTITKLGNTPLAANDLTTSAIACAEYNSSGPRFELQNPQGVGSVTSVTPVTANAAAATDQQLIELTLPAGFLNSSKQPYWFHGSGVFSTAAAQTPTLTYKVKLCTVSGCGSGTVVTLTNIVTTAALASTTNNNWGLNAVGITATTGATGNLEAHGSLAVDLGATTATADSIFNDTNTAVSANIDLTAALFVDFTVAESTASATVTITQRDGAVMPQSNPAGSGSGTSGGAIATVSQLSKGAAVSTFTLCAAATCGNGVAHQYRIDYNIWSSGTACGTVGGAAVGTQFTWTDENSQTHSAQNSPFWNANAATWGATYVPTTSLTTSSASGSVSISTNGTIIQAATTWADCGAGGPNTYNIRYAVFQLQ